MGIQAGCLKAVNARASEEVIHALAVSHVPVKTQDWVLRYKI